MKKQILVLAVLALLAGCGKEKPAAKQQQTADAPNTFTDSRDGKKYKTVKIGNQVWMAQNLNYEAEGSKCYEDDPANCEKYGRLYDWETAMKVCPKGWRLPTGDDGKTLVNFVGGEETVGTKLKSKAGWHNEDGVPMGNGTDDYGFSALPGGYGGSSVGNFYGVGYVGHWWSSSEYDNGIDAYYRVMHYNFETAHRGINLKSGLFSVRCIKDTGEQNSAEKDAAGVEAQNSKSEVQFNELQEKDGVYYLNNVPFTGTAEGFDYGPFSYTMKDGIFHGPYYKNMDGCNTAGTYKNGKEHGKWESGCGDEGTDIEIYEDGVLISINGELVSDAEETDEHEDGRIPKGYSHFDAIRGDLNGDGTDDYVLIVKGTDKKNIVKDENSGEPVDRNRRGIMIFFNNGGGDYPLALQNLKCFASENEAAGGYFPPELSVSVKKGNLYIAYNHGRYGSWTYTFRYRDGEFVMIGYDGYGREYPGADANGREIEVVEINESVNLLTEKALIKSVTHYADGENKAKEEWTGVVVKKLVKLTDIEDFAEWDKQYTIVR